MEGADPGRFWACALQAQLNDQDGGECDADDQQQRRRGGQAQRSRRKGESPNGRTNQPAARGAANAAIMTMSMVGRSTPMPKNARPTK